MEIEKNIPMPEGGSHIGRPVKYPFADMEIGDSLFFADEPTGTMSNPVVAARSAAAKRGWKVTARKEGDGVRVWRTE